MPDRTNRIGGERLQERLVDLVRMPSVSGDEEAAIRRIADWLSAAGAEVGYWFDGMAKLVAAPAYPGHEIERAWMPVVAGMIRGMRRCPTIVLTGHVDVVPPGDYNQWMIVPFTDAIESDKAYGRGAVPV